MNNTAMMASPPVEIFDDEAEMLSSITINIKAVILVKGNNNTISVDPAITGSKLAVAVVSGLRQMGGSNLGVPMIDENGRPRPITVDVDGTIKVEGSENLMGDRAVHMATTSATAAQAAAQATAQAEAFSQGHASGYAQANAQINANAQANAEAQARQLAEAHIRDEELSHAHSRGMVEGIVQSQNVPMLNHSHHYGRPSSPSDLSETFYTETRKRERDFDDDADGEAAPKRPKIDDEA